MALILDAELKTFQCNRDQLLATGEGKFVLIHGEEVVGIYESKMDAISQGYQKFGNAPFLVKQILKVEIPQNFVSTLLAV